MASPELNQFRISRRNRRALLYLDNFNILSAVRKYEGQLKGFKPNVFDVHYYPKLEQLANLAANGRDIIKKRAFGYIGNPMFTFKLLKGLGFEVYGTTIGRDFSKIEKPPSNIFVMQATDDLIVNKPDCPRLNTLILVSGNGSLLPIVKKARQHGWDVEIWSFECSLAFELRLEIHRRVGKTKVRLEKLEEIFDMIAEFIYFEWRDSIPIPKERSMSLRIECLGMLDLINLDSRSKAEVMRYIITTAENIFHVPFYHKLISAGKGIDRTTKVGLIAGIEEGNKFNFNFQSEVWNKRHEFTDQLQRYLNDRHGNYQVFIEMGGIPSASIMTMSDTESTSDSEVQEECNSNFSDADSDINMVLLDVESNNGTENIHVETEQRGNFSDFGQIHSISGCLGGVNKEFRKTKLCLHFLRGYCNFTSSECDFAHSMGEVRCFKCNTIGKHEAVYCGK